MALPQASHHDMVPTVSHVPTSYDDTFVQEDADFLMGALGVQVEEDGTVTHEENDACSSTKRPCAEQQPCDYHSPSGHSSAQSPSSSAEHPYHHHVQQTMHRHKRPRNTHHHSAPAASSKAAAAMSSVRVAFAPPPSARPLYHHQTARPHPDVFGKPSGAASSSSIRVNGRVTNARASSSHAKQTKVASSSSKELVPTKKGPIEAPFFHYQDFSKLTDPDPSRPLTAPGRIPNFPTKMHAILSRTDLADIVSWLPHGRSWRVWKPREFEVKVIPTYFEHAKFSSFIRQANGWGFRRLTKAGTDRNSYYHELFLRGVPHLVKRMHRPSSSQQKPVSDPATEPDFKEISIQCPLPEEYPADAGDQASCQNTPMAPESAISSAVASAKSDSVLAHCTIIQRGSQYRGQIITKEEDQIKIMPPPAAKAGVMIKPTIEITTVPITTEPEATPKEQPVINIEDDCEPLSYEHGDEDNYLAIYEAANAAKAAKVVSEATRIVPPSKCPNPEEPKSVLKTYKIDSREFIDENEIGASPLHFACRAPEEYDEEEEAMLQQYLAENPHVIAELQAEDAAKKAEWAAKLAEEQEAQDEDGPKPSSVASSSEAEVTLVSPEHSASPSSPDSAKSTIVVSDDSDNNSSSSDEEDESQDGKGHSHADGQNEEFDPINSVDTTDEEPSLGHWQQEQQPPMGDCQ